jgi:hypothetical protein
MTAARADCWATWGTPTRRLPPSPSVELLRFRRSEIRSWNAATRAAGDIWAADSLRGRFARGAVWSLIGAGVLVGTGAQVLQYLHVGSGAVVGAGAVVTRARVVGWELNTHFGERNIRARYVDFRH